MDARHFDLLKGCDPAELGGRLKAVRLTKGLTQADVAGDAMSVAYLSRMESGQRRPTAKVLVEIAHRLGVSVEELLGETTPREMDEIRLTLDYAELSLESGEAHEALTHVREALERLESAPADALNDRARFLERPRARGTGPHRRRPRRARGPGGRRQRLRPDARHGRHRPEPRLPGVRRPRPGDRHRRAHPGRSRRVRPGQLRRGGPADGDDRRRLLRTRRLRACGAHLPRRHRQGRGPRVSAGPRLGVLERQRHAGPPRGHPQRCSPRRAGPGAAQRGAGHQEPGPTARRAGSPPAGARPAGRGTGAAEPGEGRRRARLEQCRAGGPGLDPARPGSGTLPRRRPRRQPRADREVHEISDGTLRSPRRRRGRSRARRTPPRATWPRPPGLPGSRPPAVGHRRRPGCGAALVRPGRPARRGRAGRAARDAYKRAAASTGLRARTSTPARTLV